MRHAKALLPYALASVAVVAMSSTMVFASLHREKAAAPASAVSAPAARAELSPTARVAFWRGDRAGVLELWVGDLDGSRRWTIAREPASPEPALTRWAPDGSSVAYVRDGVSVDVVQLDGTHVSLPVPSELRATGWKIASYEWSPDARRVAATLRPAGGASRESDVFVAETRTGASWTQATTMGDAVAGRWIDDTRLFIETSSGMIAVLDVDTMRMRPITSMPAASPIVGADGRVYFFGGEWTRGDFANVPYAAGTVWSITIDGGDSRRETAVRSDQARIQGRLADGRWVLASPGTSYIAGEELVPMPWRAGTVRRVVVSADGRRAFGITESRVVRLDPARINESTDRGDADAAIVLLDGARGADVWFPSSPVSPARRAGSDPPGVRLAFLLGRTLWQMERDGEIRDVISSGADGWFGTPSWSPSGDRLAVTMTKGGGWPRSTLLVLGADGRWQTDLSAAQDVTWSPDGTRLSVVTVSGERFDEPATLTFDAGSGQLVGRADGLRAKWTDAGLVAIDAGALHPEQRMRTGQTVFLISDAARTPITDAGRIAAHPLMRALPDATLPPLISQLTPSRDGRHLGVWLYRARASGYASGAFAVVRTADGEVLSAIPFELRAGLSDVAWSPAAPIVGRTVWDGAGPTAARRASVFDALTGRVLAEREGTFAGWSPGGDSYYVARDAGLFAYPLAGGDPLRISTLGVKVVARQ